MGLEWAAAGLAAVGTAASIGATAARANAESQAASYQAQVARNNAIIANQQADAEILAGQRQAEIQSMQTAAKVAKIRAAFGARGVDVNSGSAVDVQASEREIGKIDSETALSNAQQKAYGYRSRASGYTAQAGLYDQKRGSIPEAAGWEIGGTLLSRASSLPFKDIFGSAPSTTAGSGGGGAAAP